MPTPIFTGLKPKPTFEDVCRKINELADELTNLMVNLDDANFDKITANVMDVQELSAITANLGEVTAGVITGLLIRTAVDGIYPRIQFSSTTRVLEAAANVLSSISLLASSSETGTTAFSYKHGSSATVQYQNEIDGHNLLTSRKINIQGGNGVNIYTGSSATVNISNLQVNGGTQFDTLPAPFSSATTVSQLVTDFNNLVSMLRSLNILA